MAFWGKRHCTDHRVIFFGKSVIKNVKDEDSCDDLVSHPAFITIAIDTHENIGEICVRSSSGDINIPIIFLGIFGHTNTPIPVAKWYWKESN